jgi:hypothetical protein
MLLEQRPQADSHNLVIVHQKYSLMTHAPLPGSEL